MKMKALTSNASGYLAGLLLALTPLAVMAASPSINFDASGMRVQIQPNNVSAKELMASFAEQAGFKITGTLESPAKKLEYPVGGTVERAIERIVAPQSVVIIYDKDQKGNHVVSEVKLINTGTEDSHHLSTGDTGGGRFTGNSEKDERRMRKAERRAKNRAKKLSEGTLTWSPK